MWISSNIKQKAIKIDIKYASRYGKIIKIINKCQKVTKLSNR